MELEESQKAGKVPPGSTPVIGSVIPTITCLIPIEQSSGGKFLVEFTGSQHCG